MLKSPSDGKKSWNSHYHLGNMKLLPSKPLFYWKTTNATVLNCSTTHSMIMNGTNMQYTLKFVPNLFVKSKITFPHIELWSLRVPTKTGLGKSQ